MQREQSLRSSAAGKLILTLKQSLSKNVLAVNFAGQKTGAVFEVKCCWEIDFGHETVLFKERTGSDFRGAKHATRPVFEVKCCWEIDFGH